MIKKRETAEQILKESKSDEILENIKDNHDDKSEYKNVYKNNYINVDVNTNKNNYEYIDTKKFIIKKSQKKELPKRITYYLKPSTIGKIDRLSKKASMGKSEFVQKVLDNILDNLEIK